MRIRRMRIACWIPKATNTHSDYVILTVVPLQHLLRENASMLRYMNSAYLVRFIQVVYPGTTSLAG